MSTLYFCYVKATSYAVQKCCPSGSVFGRLFWTGSGCPKVLSFFTADLKSRRHRWHTHQTQASSMLRWLPSLLLLAGMRRGTCSTLPTSSSLGFLWLSFDGRARCGRPVASNRVGRGVGGPHLQSLDKVQRHDLSLEAEPMDELPREKLTRSHREKRRKTRSFGHSWWRKKTRAVKVFILHQLCPSARVQSLFFLCDRLSFSRGSSSTSSISSDKSWRWTLSRDCG